MTDHRSPIDAALDLVLYVPFGLALTVGEELPKLAAKGRTGLNSRVATAKVVGQFAVAQGRREVTKRRNGAAAAGSPTPSRSAPLGGSAPGADGAASRPPVAGPAAAGPAASSAPPAASSSRSAAAPVAPAAPSAIRASAVAPAAAAAATAGGSPPVGAAARRGSARARSGGATGPATAAAASAPGGAAPGGVPDVGSLAIPGYDSLSASQVVQRLGGLSASELEAVKAYEAASRGRRTILARVGQLQGS